MASQGLFSIGGIASGLDTTGIIEQLMALERQPVTKLQSTQAQLRRTDDAWVQVSTRLSALRTATDAIARPDRFTSMVAVSSSNTDVATVTRAGTNATGSLTFSVRKLAAAHQVSVSGASADQQRDLTEPVRLRVGSGEVIDLSEELGASASLTQIASAINGRKAGVTASVVKVDDAETRLILTSGRTGTEHGLTVEGLGATQTLRAAADAELVIGEGAGAVTLTRSSNTITDLVPGASVTLRRTTPVDAPITVTAARDVDAGVTAVKSYVDALNGTLRTLKDLTAYDGETGRAGPLQGDATARPTGRPGSRR
jgi:flagellar hook-associated protein 2